MSRLDRFHCILKLLMSVNVCLTQVFSCVRLLFPQTVHPLSHHSSSAFCTEWLCQFYQFHRVVNKNNNSSKRINIVNNYNSTYLVLVLIVCCWFLESLWSSSLKSLFLTATEARSVPPNDARASCLALSACECECCVYLFKQAKGSDTY